MIDKLTPIFRNVFDDEGMKISRDTTAKDIDGWDSLAHIRLIVSIEKFFSVKFSASEIADLENVGDMCDLIIKKM